LPAKGYTLCQQIRQVCWLAANLPAGRAGLPWGLASWYGRIAIVVGRFHFP